MVLSRLQKLKKKSTDEGKITNVDNLVVGGDQLSFYLLSKLPENTKIMIPQLDETYRMGPTNLRGEENIKAFTALFCDLDLKKIENHPAFYRDQRFREFGGRSKPEKLLTGENYFTTQGLSFNWDQVAVPAPSDYLQLIPSHIEYDQNWLVQCTNGEKVICNKLFWSRDPSELAEIMPKESPVQHYCQQIQPLCTLHINYRFDGKIEAPERTFFIPVSYTYDWGHFIGELREDGSHFEFIYFFDKGEISEDELTKRIKILKRSVEKIFPETITFQLEEELIMRDKSPMQSIPDELYIAQENLFLSGVNAPISSKNPKLSHLGRGFQSVIDVINQQT